MMRLTLGRCGILVICVNCGSCDLTHPLRVETCHRSVSFAVTSFSLSSTLLFRERHGSDTSCDTHLSDRRPCLELQQVNGVSVSIFPEPHFSQALAQVVGTSRPASMACRHGITNVPLATTSHMRFFITFLAHTGWQLSTEH